MCILYICAAHKVLTLFLLWSLSLTDKIWMVRCRLVDGHLANEGKFSLHVFFYSWLMPSKNRKSRHFAPRWLADDDDSVSVVVYDVHVVACRFIGIPTRVEERALGTWHWQTFAHNCVSGDWRRFVFRISFVWRMANVKVVFCGGDFKLKYTKCQVFSVEDLLEHLLVRARVQCILYEESNWREHSRLVRFMDFRWWGWHVGCECRSHFANLFIDN